MRLRKRGGASRGQMAEKDRSSRRSKRSNKQSDNVWYHESSPLFDEPISDDFLGLVTPTEVEGGRSEEASVQVTLERNAAVLVPPEVQPESESYGGEQGPTGAPEEYAGAGGHSAGATGDQLVDPAGQWPAESPTVSPWSEPDVVGMGPPVSLDAPPWAMEPPGVREPELPPLESGAAPWTAPADEQSAPVEIPPEAVVPEPEASPHDEAVGGPSLMDSERSLGVEPPAAPPAAQRPFVHDSEQQPAVDPPMIIPIRAYYMTRADDTLRSVAAQFLNTPSRWQELRSLNAAYPGIANAGPDTLLPVGSSLALPGDPLPWGKPDPVYLWTLAEKFLYTAWGREPTPEEVVPFWRGLTSGAKHLDMGPSAPPAIGTPADAPIEPPIPPSMQPPVAPPAAAEPAPAAPDVPEEPAAATAVPTAEEAAAPRQETWPDVPPAAESPAADDVPADDVPADDLPADDVTAYEFAPAAVEPPSAAQPAPVEPEPALAADQEASTLPPPVAPEPSLLTPDDVAAPEDIEAQEEAAARRSWPRKCHRRRKLQRWMLNRRTMNRRTSQRRLRRTVRCRRRP